MLRTLKNDGVRFWTGCLSDGRQAIIGPSLPHVLVYLFDAEGTFLEKQLITLTTLPNRDPSTQAYVTDATFLASLEGQIIAIQEKLTFTPETIRIQDFYDASEGIAVKELPGEYEEYYDNPDAFSAEDRDSLDSEIREWQEKERYVLSWGIDLWISRDGQRLTS